MQRHPTLVRRLAGLALTVSLQPAAAQLATFELVAGAPVERTLGAGDAESFGAGLAAGRVYLLVVEQLGIDVVLTAWGPDGERLATADGPLERWGREELLLRPGAAGRHRFEVRLEHKGVGQGRYEVRLEELAFATPAARQRLAALEAAGRASVLLKDEAPGSLVAAAAAFDEARLHFRDAGDRRGEAEAVAALAALARRTGQPQRAVELYRDAASRWQELARPDRELRAWNDLGLTLWEQGELAAAEDALRRGRGLALTLEDRFGQADLGNNLCLVGHARGEIRQALECYRENLAIFSALGERGDEADVFNNLGFAWYQLGEPRQAEESYRLALAIRREVGDRAGVAQALNNLAVLFRSLGEAGEALALYAEQREILAELADRRQEAAALNNLGVAYNSLGEAERARIYFTAALELRREVADRRGEIVSLDNLGWLERGERGPAAAIPFHRQALALAIAAGDRRAEGLTRSHLAAALGDAGRFDEASVELATALALHRQVGDRLREAITLRYQGRMHLRRGEPQAALLALGTALEVARGVGDRANEAAILTLKAGTLRDLGQLDEARAAAEAAVAAVERMRTALPTPDLRASFLGSRREAFEVWVDVLMALDAARPGEGFVRLAFEASEQARARALLDLVRVDHSQPRSGAGVELAAHRRELERRVALKAERRQTQLASGRGDPAGVAALERELEAAAAELDAVDAEIRRQDPRWAELSRAGVATAAEIQALLDESTLLLEYWLGERRSWLWVIGPTAIRAFALPAREPIERAARTLHEALRSPPSPGAGRAGLGAELAATLLGPIAAELDEQRLAIVADGALHYVPFDVLPRPVAATAAGRRDEASRPLVHDHEVVELPSASVLVGLRRNLAARPAAPRLARVFADPIFGPGDSRVAAREAAVRGSGAGDPATLARLRFSRQEAEAIAALAPAGSVELELGFGANRERVLGGGLGEYRYLHFATHGVFDASRPELSGLVFSRLGADGAPREGFFSLRDAYGLELGAELVVLSGCQTALGKEIRGEGLLGLTRGFLYAGAARVLASLWWVDDRATADLMASFYHGLWSQGLPPAAALRQARLALARGRRFGDPFYWGAFILQGDWR